MKLHQAVKEQIRKVRKECDGLYIMLEDKQGPMITALQIRLTDLIFLIEEEFSPPDN